MAPYFGWLKYYDSKNLLKKIYRETNIWYSGWNGIKTNITKFKGRWIYDDKPYEFKSSNVQLFIYLNSLQKFPVLLKIEKCLQQQKSNLQLYPKYLSR